MNAPAPRSQPDNEGAITITRLETPEQREAAAERIAGMSREEAFRCEWDDCKSPGFIYLGSRQEHIVCEKCAARPELKRFKIRKLRSEVEWWTSVVSLEQRGGK